MRTDPTFQPVVRLAGRLYVLPGIPALFQKMLDALTPFLPLPEATERLKRMQIFTECVLLLPNSHPSSSLHPARQFLAVTDR